MIYIIENLLVDFFLLFLPIALLYNKRKSLDKKLFGELGLKRIEAKELVKKSSAILAVLVLLSVAILLFSTALGMNDLQKVSEAIEKTSPWFFLYLLTVRVFSEEVFFRGFLVPRIGSILSTAVFAAGHVFFGSITEVIGAFVLGLALAVFFEKNKNLFPNIIAHMLYNLFALVVFYGVGR